VFGYNGGMEKYYLEDSGRSRRINKAVSLGDERVSKALAINKKHTFLKKQNHLTYKNYEIFKNKIMLDTDNKVEKAIIFDRKNNIVFEKLGTRRNVTFSKLEVEQMNGHRLIHNHPSGFTLSYQDVVLAIEAELREIVAFSRRGVYYRLVFKENLSLKDFSLQYKKAFLEATYVVKKMVQNKILKAHQADIEFNSIIMSLFSNSTKGVYYEETKY
jgi:hypothetical protein